MTRSPASTEEGGAVALETAFTEALRADTDGVLHKRISRLAGRLMKWSCERHHLDRGVQAEAFSRLALELCDLMRVREEHGAPATAGAAATERLLPSRDVAARLAGVADAIDTRTGGSLRPATTDPAELWAELHLGCGWLDEAVAADCRRLLDEVAHAEPDDEYLIPPAGTRTAARCLSHC
jgi:hypothetical protein